MQKYARVVIVCLLAAVFSCIIPGISLAETNNLTIGPMNYSSGPLVVGEQETLNFTLKDGMDTTGSRTYWVEMYGVRGTTAYLKASKNVTIPAGYSTTSVTFLSPFTTPGPVYTLIKIYTTPGGKLLAERQSTYTNTVYGYWTIKISMPKSRLSKGTLTLYNAEGTAQMKADCLGLSQYRSTTTMYQTNGNTPTGIYQGHLDGPYTPTYSYGPYKVVNMTAMSGAAKTSGRSGIWIHGGDPGTISSVPAILPLRMTNGCVRISNTDQLKLQTKITELIQNYHYADGTIFVDDF